jgi:hypothetical protein
MLMNKQDFAQLLEMHDWHYGRSEDPRAYKKGAEQRKLIFKIKAQLGEDGEYLYLKYARKYEENMTAPISNRRERVMRGVMCKSTGKLGFLVDKSANGFLEVKFKDAHRTEFLRAENVTMLD